MPGIPATSQHWLCYFRTLATTLPLFPAPPPHDPNTGSSGLLTEAACRATPPQRPDQAARGPFSSAAEGCPAPPHSTAARFLQEKPTAVQPKLASPDCPQTPSTAGEENAWGSWVPWLSWDPRCRARRCWRSSLGIRAGAELERDPGDGLLPVSCEAEPGATK